MGTMTVGALSPLAALLTGILILSLIGPIGSWVARDPERWPGERNPAGL